MKEKRLAGAALYHIIIFAIGIIMCLSSDLDGYELL